jgi:ubiquinone/menaquinone biosynthesis C-methylase UbiE
MQTSEYAKLAAVEDRMWYFRVLHRRIEDQLRVALGKEAALLDAGCGTGGLIRRLAPAHGGWRWTGLDLDATALGFARDRVPPGVHLTKGSVEDLPFADQAFDAVISADVLYHLDDDAAAAAEAWRVLRPGGVFVVNVPAYPWLWSYHDEAVAGRRRYLRPGLTRLLRAAGFARVRATYCNASVLPLVVARRKLLPAPKGGSDVELQAAPVEVALAALGWMENLWLRDGGALPFGSSVLAIAEKA